ncbi:MAG: hypothetical protein L0177_12735 [Chloroflexi bacterium]|nr:hypothetical protein [Chloroflexota bacterium]
MEREQKEKRLYTRRQLLMGVPAGFAGAFIANVMSGGLLTSLLTRHRRSKLPDFPEDSIFAPARDRKA